MMKAAIAAFLVAVSILFSLSGCEADTGPAAVVVPADSAAGEVDFQLTGPGGAALLVPVHINGEGPFDFVLDTGATLMCLDERLIERLAVPVDTRRSGIGAGIQGTGQIQLVRLDSVRIWDAQANELSACVLDLAHTQALGIEFDGLIGLNFLREFRVTLDFARNVMTLQ
jgi:predicted aspartyl protease